MRDELVKATGSEAKAHVIMENLNPSYFEKMGLDWSEYLRFPVKFAVENEKALSKYIFSCSGQYGSGCNYSASYRESTPFDFSF